jgi:hypothetical protein
MSIYIYTRLQDASAAVGGCLLCQSRLPAGRDTLQGAVVCICDREISRRHRVPGMPNCAAGLLVAHHTSIDRCCASNDGRGGDGVAMPATSLSPFHGVSTASCCSRIYHLPSHIPWFTTEGDLKNATVSRHLSVLTCGCGRCKRRYCEAGLLFHTDRIERYSARSP